MRKMNESELRAVDGGAWYNTHGGRVRKAPIGWYVYCGGRWQWTLCGPAW